MKRKSGIAATLIILVGLLWLPPWDRVAADEGYGPIDSTTQFAVDANGSVAYLPGTNTRVLWTVDTSSGQVISSLRLPFPCTGVALSETLNMLVCFSATRSLLSFLIPPSYYYKGRILRTVHTQSGPRLAEFDPSGDTLCVLSPDSQTIEGVDTNTFHQEFALQFTEAPYGMTHATTGAAISFPISGTITKLDPNTHQPTLTQSVFPGVDALSHGMDDVGPTLIAVTRFGNKLAILDGNTFEILVTTDVGSPHDVHGWDDGARSVAYVLSGHFRQTIEVVDAARGSLTFGTIIRTINLPEPVEALAVARNNGTLFALARTHLTLYLIVPARGFGVGALPITP